MAEVIKNMAGHRKWSEIKHKSGAGKTVQKWRATFEVEYYNDLSSKWYADLGTRTRVIERESYDHAVIYANAMVGEEYYLLPHFRKRLERLMFIEVVPDDADLNENCADLKTSQERAERIFRERSGRNVIEAMKRFEMLGF